MVQPKQFKYTMIVRGVDTFVLPNAPDGWDESLIKWMRSPEYYGMIRTFSVPLKFVLDGAWILRTEWYTYGLRAEVQLRIDELNPATWVYELAYLGDIDFSEIVDGIDEVEVNMMDAGIEAKIKARENIEYEIDLEDANAIDIELTPLIQQEQAQFILVPEVGFKVDCFFGVDRISDETTTSQASTQSVVFEQNGSPNFATSDKWFFEAQVDTDVLITGHFKGTLGTASLSSTQYLMNIVKQDGTVPYTIYSKIASDFNIYPFDVTFSTTISLLAGERLFLYFAVPGTAPSGSGFKFTGATDEFNFTAGYDTIYPATMCKALRPKYLLSRLLNKMNDGVDYPVQSTLLDTWTVLAVTSGDGIRQIPGAKIRTSFKSYFQSINSVLNAGFGFEGGKAVLEAKAYWFKSNLPAGNTGLLKSFKNKSYDPYLYNSVRVGYPDKTYDRINGRSEVNSTQVWSLPLDRVQKEMNLVSVYRADPYGIEDIRVRLTGKNTTDSKSDNDTFFVKVKSAPEAGQTYYHPERSEGYISMTTIAGLPVPSRGSLYNWDITPHRNLLRHGDYLHSILDKYDGYQIKFESALKNVDLVVTDLNGLRVQENQNIDVSTLPARIFLPIVSIITTKLPVNMLALMDSFPTGYIAYSYLGYDWRGFMMNAGVDVSRNSPREFELLLTPDNLIGNFIH